MTQERQHHLARFVCKPRRLILSSGTRGDKNLFVLSPYYENLNGTWYHNFIDNVLCLNIQYNYHEYIFEMIDANNVIIGRYGVLCIFIGMKECQ